MDVWSVVAAYLLRRNPNCAVERRGGAQLACASSMHRAAVQNALREARFPKCARPLALRNERSFRFCLHCPTGFEFDIAKPSGRNCNYQVVRAKCVQIGELLRFTLCLAESGGRPCAYCERPTTELPPPYNKLTANVFMHDARCPGCLPVIPVICGACCQGVSILQYAMLCTVIEPR